MRQGINQWKAAKLLPYLHDKSQIQSEGSPELVLEIKLTIGDQIDRWMGISVT